MNRRPYTHQGLLQNLPKLLVLLYLFFCASLAIEFAAIFYLSPHPPCFSECNKNDFYCPFGVTTLSPSPRSCLVFTHSIHRLYDSPHYHHNFYLQIATCMPFYDCFNPLLTPSLYNTPKFSFLTSPTLSTLLNPNRQTQTPQTFSLTVPTNFSYPYRPLSQHILTTIAPTPSHLSQHTPFLPLLTYTIDPPLSVHLSLNTTPP